MIAEIRCSVGGHREGCRRSETGNVGRRCHDKRSGTAYIVDDLVHPGSIYTRTVQGVLGVSPLEVVRAGAQEIGMGFPALLAGDLVQIRAVTGEAKDVCIGLRGDFPPERECAGSGNGGAQPGLRTVRQEEGLRRRDAVVRDTRLPVPGRDRVNVPSEVIIEREWQRHGRNYRQAYDRTGCRAEAVSDDEGVVARVGRLRRR